MESMIRMLDPSFDYIKAFHEEISRLTSKRFSLERTKDKTINFALDLERLAIEAPGNTRRILSRLSDGNLGRVHAPAIEALGGRATRYLGRLQGTILTAALLISGALMVNSPQDAGWHHKAGEFMVYAGVLNAVLIQFKAMRRNPGRR
jgi:ubiquinone biosynthesis protein